MAVQLTKKPRVTVGDEFESLTVDGRPFGIRLGAENKIQSWVVAECKCGNAAVLWVHAILTGNTKSCGCRHLSQGGMARHGDNRDPLYTVWCSLRQRCSDDNSPGYKDYGGRGIYVCDEWLQSFSAFREWAIANGWKKRMNIDRFPDNNGPYAPWNCRVVPAKINHRNKRSNLRITAFGETKVLAEWMEDSRCRTTVTTISGRIKRGWSTEAAIETPSLPMGGYRQRGVSLEHKAQK